MQLNTRRRKTVKVLTLGFFGGCFVSGLSLLIFDVDGELNILQYILISTTLLSFATTILLVVVLNFVEPFFPNLKKWWDKPI